MVDCWGFVATKVHHPAQGNLFMKQTPPPRSYNSALSMSSCWCFGQKLQFLVLFLLTQGSKTFLNSTCLSLNGAVTQEVQLMSNGLKKTYWIVLRKVRTFRRHQQTASISCMLHAVKVRFLQYPNSIVFLGVSSYSQGSPILLSETGFSCLMSFL